MEYQKPELVLVGHAESLVLGIGSGSSDPSPVGGHTTTGFAALEFED